MMNKTLKWVVPAALAMAATASWGQSAGSPKTANFDVTTRVNNACTITATPVTFGSYDPLSATPVDYTSAVLTVTCTKGSTTAAGGGGTGAVAPVVSLNAGSNASGAQRKMLNQASGNTDTIDYDFYVPAQSGANTNYDTCNYATAALWSPTTNVTPSAAFWTGSARTFAVCGRIPALQAATGISVGDYKDTVTASVNF